MTTIGTATIPDPLIPSYEQLSVEVGRLRAELAAKDALLAEATAALRLHKAWADAEKGSPNYGCQTRDTHPDGERIWRLWFDNNLDLCSRAEDATDAFLAKLKEQE